MLLEVVEKLLALLIIVAMLILVMFLALPDSGRDNRRADRGDPEPATRERVVIQQVPEPEVTPIPAPEPARQLETSKPSGEVVVPDPRSRTQHVQPAERTEAPAPKQDIGRGEVKISSAPKSPKRPDRLPMTAPEPVPTVKAAKIRPKVKTETIAFRQVPQPSAPEYQYRTQPQQTQQTQPTQPRKRSYVRTAKYRGRWDRTDYYECQGGSCDCSCNQPYWSRSGPCWD